MNRTFSINRFFLIIGFLPMIDFFLFFTKSEKKKIQQIKRHYGLLHGPSMAVRPPEEQPIQKELIEFLLLIEIFLLIENW